MNNFDQSSQGVNLELLCFIDTDIARMDYQDLICKHSNDYDLIMFDGVKEELDKATVKRMDLYKAMDLPARDFLELWGEWTDEKELPFFEACDILAEHYGRSDYLNAIDQILPHGFEYQNSTGYSQGDSEAVIVGDTETINATLKAYDNILWDAPIYCRLEIDDDEVYLDEYLSDLYSYEKDEILAGFEKNYQGEHKAYILEWLDENLPIHPDVR